MRTPTPAQLLQVWERGGDAPVAACCLALLAACCDEGTHESLASLPLGRRDVLLLELRARLFGEQVSAVTDCPACATAVEANFSCDDLLAGAPDRPEGELPHDLASHGLRVRFRLPDSTDLLAVHGCGGAGAARRMLLDRCVIDIRGGAGPAHALPSDLQTEIAQAMATADPQADLQIALSCPQCAHRWQPVFDIALFLWQELHAWALRMLREIDALAHTYHWTEADILGLSPRRRQAYLELCQP